MSEHTNKYVVSIATGHPGRVDCSVISTRDAMIELVAKLQAALDHDDDRKVVDGWGEALASRTLLSEYATIAKGQRDRVTLTFKVTDDLAPFHVDGARRRLKSGVRQWPKYLVAVGIILVVLYFAALGVLATLGT